MEALKLIGAGHRVLLVRDDLVKLVDLGSIFSSAPKKEYLFSIHDITKIEIKKPGAVLPGSIQIQGYKISPALQNNITVFFAGDENYKIAISMQNHIKELLNNQSTLVGDIIATIPPSKSTSAESVPESISGDPELESTSSKPISENPFYSVFQELKALYPQNIFSTENYKNTLSQINSYLALCEKIPAFDFNLILDYESSGMSVATKKHNTYGHFLSFESIVSHLKSRGKRLSEIVSVVDWFNDTYNGLQLVDIEFQKGVLPVRFHLKDMPEIKPSPVREKFDRNYLASFIVMDTETTGLAPKSDYIIELSAIRFDDFKPAEAFSTFIKPPCNIPEVATKINHITDSMVSAAPTIEEVMPAFMAFCEKLPLVGHNLSFDLKFLYVNGFDLSVKRKYFDTLSISRRIKDFSLENYKLDTVCRAFGIYRDDAHRALSDCLATGLLFDEMTQYITTN